MKNTANYIKGKVNDYRSMTPEEKSLSAMNVASKIENVFNPYHKVRTTQTDHLYKLGDKLLDPSINKYRKLNNIIKNGTNDEYNDEIKKLYPILSNLNLNIADKPKSYKTDSTVGNFPINKYFMYNNDDPIDNSDKNDIKSIINYVDRTNKYKDNPTK